MGAFLDSRDVIVNELRSRLLKAAKNKDIAEIEKYAVMIEQLMSEFTHELEDEEIALKIRESAREDFMKIVCKVDM